jgi:NAD(P)-dependent dehydrogenase (short-subunit alcohol dehydrogenase family)
VPLLKKSRANPCIVAMSSVAGRLGYAYRTPYAVTKWAIVGLTKSLAIELGPPACASTPSCPARWKASA